MKIGIQQAMMRWSGLFAALVVLLLLVRAPAVTASDDPQVVLAGVTDHFLTEVRASREALAANPERIHALVREIILPHIDFEMVSRRVLGKAWRTATPVQRAQFARAFETRLLRTYAAAIPENADVNFRFHPVRLADGARKATVRSEIPGNGGPPIRVNYAVYKRDENWLIYDVTIEGISMVTNYKQTFAREIRKHGLDGLIARLEGTSAASAGQVLVADTQ